MADNDLIVRGRFDTSDIDIGITLAEERFKGFQAAIQAMASQLPDLDVTRILADARAEVDRGEAALRRMGEAARQVKDQMASITGPGGPGGGNGDLAAVLGIRAEAVHEAEQQVARLRETMLTEHQAAERGAQGHAAWSRGVASAGANASTASGFVERLETAVLNFLGLSSRATQGIGLDGVMERLRGRTREVNHEFEQSVPRIGRLANILETVAARGLEAEGPLARLAGFALAFGGGEIVLVGVAAAVATVVGAYHFLTTAQREVREEQDKQTKALLDAANNAMPAVERSARSLAGAQETLARANKVGVIALLAARAPGSATTPITPIVNELFRQQLKQAEDAERAVAFGERNLREQIDARIAAEAQAIAQVITAGNDSNAIRSQAVGLEALLTQKIKDTTSSTEERLRAEAALLALRQAEAALPNAQRDTRVQEIAATQAAQVQAIAQEQQLVKDAVHNETITRAQGLADQRALTQAAADADIAAIRQRIAVESARPTFGNAVLDEQQRRTVAGLNDQIAARRVLLGLQQQQIDREARAAREADEATQSNNRIQAIARETQARTAALASEQSLADKRRQLYATGYNEQTQLLGASLAQQAAMRRQAEAEQRATITAGAAVDIAGMEAQITELQARSAHGDASVRDNLAGQVAALRDQIEARTAVRDVALAQVDIDNAIANAQRAAAEAEAQRRAALTVAGDTQQQATAQAAGIKALGDARIRLASAVAAHEEHLFRTNIATETALRHASFDLQRQEAEQIAAAEIAGLQARLAANKSIPRTEANATDLAAEQASLERAIEARTRQANITQAQINLDQQAADEGARAYTTLAGKISGAVAVARALNDVIQGTGRDAGDAVGNVLDLGEALATVFDPNSSLFQKIEGVIGAVGSVGKLLGIGRSQVEQDLIDAMKSNEQAVHEASRTYQSLLDRGLPGITNQQEALRRVQESPAAQAALRSGDLNAFERAVEATGISLDDLRQIARANGISLVQDHHLVEGGADALKRALEEAAFAATHLADTFDVQRRTLQQSQQVFGITDPNTKLSQERALVLSRVTLDPATEQRINDLDLTTDAGRKAYKEWIQQMFQLGRAGQLTADQLSGFPDVDTFLQEMADNAGILSEAEQAAADKITKAAEEQAEAARKAAQALQSAFGDIAERNRILPRSGLATFNETVGAASTIPAIQQALNGLNASNAADRDAILSRLFDLLIKSQFNIPGVDTGGLDPQAFQDLLTQLADALKGVADDQERAAKALLDAAQAQRRAADIRAKLQGTDQSPRDVLARWVRDFEGAFPTVRNALNDFAGDLTDPKVQQQLRQRLITILDNLNPGDAARDDVLQWLEEGAGFLQNLAEDAKKAADAQAQIRRQLAEEAELRSALAGERQDPTAKFAREVARLTAQVPSFARFFNDIDLTAKDPATRKALQQRLLKMFDTFGNTDFAALGIQRDEFIAFLKDGADSLGLFSDQVSDATKSMLNFPTSINLAALEFQAQAAGAKTLDKMTSAMVERSSVAVQSGGLDVTLAGSGIVGNDGAALPTLVKAVTGLQDTLQQQATRLQTTDGQTIAVYGDVNVYITEPQVDARTLADRIAAQTRRKNMAQTGDSSKGRPR